MTGITGPAHWDNLERRFPALKQFAGNPVVIRDLRAQMRSVRSYWFIGGYLFLIGALAIAGYAQATGQSLNPLQWTGAQRSIVDAQANLEGFYNFIYATLAVLITVIAPALTASSVVGERQRQSFDLLVTTPLTSGHLLVGKLLSSIAFLGLLLLLSLPASALCILLGGATPTDVLRVYFLLAVDGVVLSAIGLYFSCAVRVPLLATLWTYAAVGGFCGLTWGAYQLLDTVAKAGNMPNMPPVLSLLWLNPLVAYRNVPVGDPSSLTTALYLGLFLLLGFLLVRQLLLAATYRLGLFGGQSGISLRKQALVLIAGFTYLLSEAMARILSNSAAKVLEPLPPGADLYTAVTGMFGGLVLIAFLVLLPFLPGLFVPGKGEGTPGWTAEEAETHDPDRLFDLRRLFHPQHSGALPWYIACLLTFLTAVFAGLAGAPIEWVSAIPFLLTGGGYLLALGVLAWTLARLAGRLVADLSSARATAFGLMIAVGGLPTLLFADGRVDWKANWLAPLWVLSPAIYLGKPDATLDAIIRSSVVALAVAVVVFLMDQEARRHPVDRSATAR